MNYFCDYCHEECAQDIYNIPTGDNDVMEVNVCSDICLRDLKKEQLEE